VTDDRRQTDHATENGYSYKGEIDGATTILPKILQWTIHRVSENSRIFCHNFVKFLLTLIIFGTKMAKTIKLCKMHYFFISPNLCQRTTVWNTDAPNCYITRFVLYQIAHFCIINLTESATCFNNFVVLIILR